MIEPAQEPANWRLLDGLLAQTLLASLPRLDAARQDRLQRLAQDIESCATDQLRPRLRLVEQKIIPAQLVGGPAKMGLIDFACPSRRAPEAKWRSLLTLNNRAHGAEIDFHEDYDSPVARTIPLGVRTWAGGTSGLARRLRRRIPLGVRTWAGGTAGDLDRFARLNAPESALGRPQYLSISATAYHFAVALGRALEIHPFPDIKPEPESELSAAPKVWQWNFNEEIEWIEFDRVLEGLIVVRLRDGSIVAVDTNQNPHGSREMQMAGFAGNRNTRIVGVADRSLWLSDGHKMSCLAIEHSGIWRRDELLLPGKGDSEHIMTMSADGIWACWVEPWLGTHWRLKLDSEALEPEQFESHPQREHQGPYATKAVFITSNGAILSVNRDGQLIGGELMIRLVLKISRFPSDFKAIVSADEKRMFWDVDGSFQSVNLTHSKLLGGRSRLGHETSFDDDDARSSGILRANAMSGIFRANSIIGRFEDGVATLWLPSDTDLPKRIPLGDIISVESAGNYLFALIASRCGSELWIIDTRNHTHVSRHQLGLEALLTAHDSGQVIAVTAQTREIRVIGVEKLLQSSIRVPTSALVTWSRDGRFFAIETWAPERGPNVCGIAIIEATDGKLVHLWNRPELPSDHKISALALSQNDEVFVGTDRGWIGRYSNKRRRFDWLDTHSRREVKILLLLEQEQRLLGGNLAALRLYDLKNNSLMAFLGNLSRDILVDTVRDGFGSPQIRVTTLGEATICEQSWLIEEESHG